MSSAYAASTEENFRDEIEQHQQNNRDQNISGEEKNNQEAQVDAILEEEGVEFLDENNDELKVKNHKGSITLEAILASLAAISSITYPLTCFDQPSAWIVSLAGLYYIITQTINWKKYKKLRDNQKLTNRDFTAISNVHEKYVSVQVDIIEESAKVTKEYAEATLSRAKSTLWFSIFVTVAVVIVIVEMVLERVSGKSAKCTTVGKNASINKTPSQKILDKILLIALEIFKNAGLSKANALEADSLLKGIGGAGVGLIGLVSAGKLVKAIMAAKKTADAVKVGAQKAETKGAIGGIGRLILLSAFSVFGYIAFAVTKKEGERLEKRAALYQSLADKIKARTADPEGVDTGEVPSAPPIPKIPDSENGPFDPSSDGSDGVCVQGQLTSPKFSSSHCPEGLKYRIPKQKTGKLSIPKIVGTTAKMLKDNIESLSRGKGTKGSLTRSSGIKLAKRLRSTKKNMMNSLNKLLKKDSRPPVQIDNAFANALKKAMISTYQGLSPNQKGALASMGAQAPASIKKRLNNNNRFLKSDKSLASQLPSLNWDSNSQFGGFDSKNPPDSSIETEELDAASELVKYQTKAADISDHGISIWRRITGRYKSSAFKIFFKKKKKSSSLKKNK